MQFTGDYKTQFEKATTQLVMTYIPNRVQRMEAVKQICDQYLQDIGTNPDPRQIERLTDYILLEELTDMDPDKITNNDYPFHSERQIDRRDRQRIGSGAMDTVGTDGVNHTGAGRRKRTNYEHRLIDAAAIKSNRERKAQYKRDTDPGEIVTYNTAQNVEPPVDFSQSRGVLAFYLSLGDPAVVAE